MSHTGFFDPWRLSDRDGTPRSLREQAEIRRSRRIILALLIMSTLDLCLCAIFVYFISI